MHWLLKVMMNEVNTGYSYRSGLIRSDLVVGAGEGGKKKEGYDEELFLPSLVR